MSSKRGYFGIGIYHPKNECNLGTLMRSAHAFGADFVYTVGRPYRRQSSDTTHAAAHVPYFHIETLEDWRHFVPKGAIPIIIELTDHSINLTKFSHPERAVYLLGNEGGGLPLDLLKRYPCVQIDTKYCLNVSTAGSIVMFHRRLQHQS